MKPQGETLEQYMSDRSRVSVITGPLGSGKTVQTCQKIFKLMCEQQPDADGVRRSRWFAIRNTYGDLFNTTIKDWLALFEELGHFSKGGSSPPNQKLDFNLDDGTSVIAEMIFIALDRDDSVKKLRGSQVTGFWLNELKELPKAVVDMADLRHGRYPANPTWHGMVADTNAPDQDHWLYTLAEETKPEDWAFYKQPGGVIRNGLKPNGRVNWIDNPDAENYHNLPDGYYAKGMQGKTDDWVAVNLANEYGFVSDGKPVYPEYNDTLHCMEFDFLPNVPIYRGWDFGVPACVLAQYTPKGRLIVRREFTSKQTMGIDRFADHVLNECATLKDYTFIDVGDPSGNNKSLGREGETCFTILWDKGIDVEPAPTQDPQIRQEAVRYFLDKLIEGRPAFILHPETKVLRKGFQGGYCLRRMKVAGEKFADKPDKHNPFSHIQDTLQYICCFIRMGYDEPEYEEAYTDKGQSKIGGY